MYAPEIDRAEMLRYLGYGARQPDARTGQRIEAMLDRCKQEARPAWRYAIADLGILDGVPHLLPWGIPLPGKAITRHLAGAKKCAVLAVTLGLGAERALHTAQQRSIADALLLDAAMSACVEAAADACSREVAQEAARLGLRAGARFSPGYADLPLCCQQIFESLLDMQKQLGIHLTSGYLLLPQKSVTAFIGLFPDEPVIRESGCKTCALCPECAYRKNGPCPSGRIGLKEESDVSL